MKVNFIVPEHERLKGGAFSEMHLPDYSELYRDGPFCWSLQTYFHVRKLRPDVTCSFSPDRNAINFAHYACFDSLPFTGDEFVVCIQADYPRFRGSPLHVVQNGQSLDDRSRFVPLWPQYGLIPRSSSRGGQFTNVGYFGRPNAADTSTEAWCKIVSQVGMNFLSMPADRWHDYSEVDLVVGHRGFDDLAYETKPATKLLNAWRAGVPFVSGGDSAHRQIGAAGVDYFEAESANDLVSLLKMLKADPDQVASVVRKGSEKAQLYSDESIARTWIDIIEEIEREIYPRWSKGRVFNRWRDKIVWRVNTFANRSRTALSNGVAACLGTSFQKELRRKWRL